MIIFGIGLCTRFPATRISAGVQWIMVQLTSLHNCDVDSTSNKSTVVVVANKGRRRGHTAISDYAKIETNRDTNGVERNPWDMYTN